MLANAFGDVVMPVQRTRHRGHRDRGLACNILDGGGFDDGDVVFSDEEFHVSSGVGSGYADMAELAGNSRSDSTGFIDAVVAGPITCVLSRAGAGPA